jgi:hypothetical protein
VMVTGVACAGRAKGPTPHRTHNAIANAANVFMMPPS